ncbi:hypothetical protein C5Y96_06385 [Blastopirellula marina]|uniref:Uncharacterized protein n=2 Tax=Pirellulales TaxID=2691354 RepID=A0A2S8FX88_9BACT|nr:hypothetical protein C5Y96_06385 [Blastopirellula marina]RCS53506.1 hypothetical protein DTL36_06395 [Bremerella cremea]
MADLRSPTLIYLKGFLFVVLGMFASGILLAKVGDWQIAVLLGLSIWAFCRAYYFAFYVIQHYVDPGYKFAGLGDFVVYVWSGGCRSRSNV